MCIFPATLLGFGGEIMCIQVLCFFSENEHYLRKHFLTVTTHCVHLKGIAGPGAPHVFALDRRCDLGRHLATKLHPVR